MMENQSQWLLEHFKSKNSPFWQAVKKISRTYNGEDFLNSGFVWDDLIAVDYKNGSIGKISNKKYKSDKNKIWAYSKEKLLMELKIAQPTHIIFFTGEDKNYDECLEWILGLQFKVEDCPPLTITRNNQTKVLNDVKTFSYTHPANNHEIKCYRTHHPNRLSYLHLNHIIDDLASLF